MSRFHNYLHTVLTRYRPKPKIRKEHNLLSANNGTVEEEEDTVRESCPSASMLTQFEDPWYHYALLASSKPSFITCTALFSSQRQNLTLALISDSPTINLQQMSPVTVPRMFLHDLFIHTQPFQI
jgi:hypothetical protein